MRQPKKQQEDGRMCRKRGAACWGLGTCLASGSELKVMPCNAFICKAVAARLKT